MTYSRQTTHIEDLRTESMGQRHRRTPVCVLTAKIAVICRLVQFLGHTGGFAQLHSGHLLLLLSVIELLADLLLLKLSHIETIMSFTLENIY